ncbi:MAG: hypothetical protein WCP79_06855 [Bacillota bacterium]
MIKIYGVSDDLIEFRGHYNDEISIYDKPLQIEFSDGTIIEIEYAPGDVGAIWKIKIICEGDGIESFVECTDENAQIYSDILTMCDGVYSEQLEKICTEGE